VKEAEKDPDVPEEKEAKPKGYGFFPMDNQEFDEKWKYKGGKSHATTLHIL
jgi:hypothetical protein